MVYRLTFLLILSNFNFYNTLLMEKAAHNNYEDHDNEELNDEEAKEKQFALRIKQHDQIKLLLKKLSILKEGYSVQISKKKDLEAEIQKTKSKIGKYQQENQRKERKYEQLTSEIKKLKDDLIQQRSYKQKIYLELCEKEEESRVKHIFQQGSTNPGLGLFGFRGLFSNQTYR